MASFHEDGIIDLLLGTYGLVWSIMLFTDDQSFATFWLVLLFPFYWGLKKQITLPRIGFVKFSQSEGNGILRGFLSALVALALAAGIVVLLSGVGASFRLYMDLIIGGSLALAGARFGYISSIKRFYIYAILALVTFFTAQYSGLPLGYHLLVSSAVITGSGLYLLYIFIKKYPLVRLEDQDA